MQGDGSGLGKKVRREESQGEMEEGSQERRGHRKGGLTGSTGPRERGVPGKNESKGGIRGERWRRGHREK